MNTTIAKQITFTKRIIAKAKRRMRDLGVNNFPDYVRYLVLRDTESVSDMVSIKEEREIKDSLEDVKKGSYTRLKSQEDIDEFIEKL
jgi:hypothetical protein